VGCRRRAPAAELVRVVRSADGSLALGEGRPGRGAWLCASSPGCLELARRRRAFERALGGPVTEASLATLEGALLTSETGSAGVVRG